MSDKIQSDQAPAIPAAAVDEDASEAHLGSLEEAMTKAFKLRRKGKDDLASDLFRTILRVEPRLAEPRLELAHEAAAREDWEEAEAQARMAVQILRAGGQWTLELDADQLLAFALNLLGEVLVRAIEDGDLIFRDKERFDATWNEVAALFQEATALDPTHRDARSNATHYRPIARG